MKTNFIDLLHNSIEIPLIQRDYAQGRKDEKSTKVRKDFLGEIFKYLIPNEKKFLELDFIYGFNTEENSSKKFVPIDGQQRLTTLWLIYWFVAAKEQVSKDQKGFLNNFHFEVRHSTTVFCERLLDFLPTFKTPIDYEIKNQSWYFNTWDYDPSITAMLNMLHDIELTYRENHCENVWKLLTENNGPFKLYKLDMDAVGLSDDLYIKMNSRGKTINEFEYFKTGFIDLISDEDLQKRFELSIDQHWIDAVWNAVIDSNYISEKEDNATVVDNCFLRLFNYITNILSSQKGINTFYNAIDSALLLPKIYTDRKDFIFLFDLLDKVANEEFLKDSYWNKYFYLQNIDFDNSKTRLFTGYNNLLFRCITNYDKVDSRRFGFPEQLILLACLTSEDSNNFARRIHTIKNVVINSDNELRNESIGESFKEVMLFINTGNFDHLINFRTSQVEEEVFKFQFLSNHNEIINNQLLKLDNNNIFRGSLSLIHLDDSFQKYANVLLQVFDEDTFEESIGLLSNALLALGDFTQTHNGWKNMLAKNQTIYRKFLTHNGFDKTDFVQKSKKVIYELLEYLVQNPSVELQKIIDDKLVEYESSPKDWKFYFLKYPSFRWYNNKGYYYWRDSNYIFSKMKEMYFNGYNWDPFLHEFIYTEEFKFLSMINFGGKLEVLIDNSLINITSLVNGFLFKNANSDNEENLVLNLLVEKGLLDSNFSLIIQQDQNNIDLEDRVEKLRTVLENLVKL